MNDETDRKLPALVSGGSIRPIIPTDFDSAWRIANAVVVAGMAPKELNTPERCTIAIMHGLEVGLPPMAALQSIAIINNRPCIWGDGALGLVQSSGKMETIKETLEGTGDARIATCIVRRKGDPELKIGRFSVADAKQAKLWDKRGAQGQDTPWITYPQRMLQMRARAWALRDGFADVLKGLAIAEEWRDVEVAAIVPPTPPKPPAKEQAKMPPKPPAKEKPKEEPKPKSESQKDISEEGGFIDDSVNEELTIGELLEILDKSLDDANDAVQVEEIWNEHDLPAKLQSMSQGEEFQGVALGIKRRHLRRFE